MSNARPHWAQLAKISWDEENDQFMIRIGYVYGGKFQCADTLWTQGKPQDTIGSHYPGIEVIDLTKIAA